MHPNISLQSQRSCALRLNAPQSKFAITKIMCTMFMCTPIQVCKHKDHVHYGYMHPNQDLHQAHVHYICMHQIQVCLKFMCTMFTCTQITICKHQVHVHQICRGAWTAHVPKHASFKPSRGNSSHTASSSWFST